MRKVLVLFVLTLLLTIGCSGNQPPVQSPAQDEQQIAKESPSEFSEYRKVEVPDGPLLRVLWVNQNIAGTLVRKLKSPVLLFVYSNEFQPSIAMDMITFADPDVAQFINENFVATRADYSAFDGNFAPCTIMVLSKRGEVISTIVGPVPPDEILPLLKKSLELAKESEKDEIPYKEAHY